MLPALIFVVGCGSAPNGADGAIRKAMAEQEAAWDRGDIVGFMVHYADDICFISPKGQRCGKAEVQASYERNYPDKESMGNLVFDVHEVLPAGREHAWCTGSWSLLRAADTLGGGFSLLWEHRTDGWRIVRDHTY
ncbi:MAG: DUF4440 domain-containing protein [Flavobacteriales bacterium]